jgi:hypothetical protein
VGDHGDRFRSGEAAAAGDEPDEPSFSNSHGMISAKQSFVHTRNLSMGIRDPSQVVGGNNANDADIDTSDCT